MKYIQIFFIVLILIFTYINGLKLKKNIKKHTNNLLNKNEKQKLVELKQKSDYLDKMIEKVKKDKNYFINDAYIDAKREMKEEEKYKK